MSAGEPLVSVVIPTRSRPGLVERAIASVLSQTYRNVEAIVVDDAGERPIKNSGRDTRVRVIRLEESRGSNNARNRGAELARGHWITFLDDDDELFPHMVDATLEALRRSELPRPVTVVTAMEIVDPSGNVLDVAGLPADLPKGSHYLLDGNAHGRFFASNAFVAERELFLAMGGWDVDIDVWHHDDIYIRLNRVSSLLRLDRVGYRLHAHEGPRLSGDLLGSARGRERTELKHRALFRKNRRRHARFLSATGVYYLRAGRWGAAIRLTSKGLLRDPRQAQLWMWWAASLVGPGGVAAYKALRGSLRPSRTGRP